VTDGRIPVTWTPRGAPLIARAVAAVGPAARALADRLAALDDAALGALAAVLLALARGKADAPAVSVAREAPAGAADAGADSGAAGNAIGSPCAAYCTMGGSSSSTKRRVRRGGQPTDTLRFTMGSSIDWLVTTRSRRSLGSRPGSMLARTSAGRIRASPATTSAEAQVAPSDSSSSSRMGMVKDSGWPSVCWPPERPNPSATASAPAPSMRAPAMSDRGSVLGMPSSVVLVWSAARFLQGRLVSGAFGAPLYQRSIDAPLPENRACDRVPQSLRTLPAHFLARGTALTRRRLR